VGLIREYLMQHGDQALDYIYATKGSSSFSGLDMRVTEHTFLVGCPPERNSHNSQWADFRKGIQNSIEGLPSDWNDLPNNSECPV
jgi:hypothetical protein